VSVTPNEFDFHDCEVALGNAIRLTREHKLMTQAELGDRVGLDEKAIARIEAGDGALDLNAIAELTMKGLDIRFGEIGHLTDQFLGRT
jgi:transcriptional regulator with XRE-family HTH domain